MEIIETLIYLAVPQAIIGSILLYISFKTNNQITCVEAQRKES